MMALQGRLLCWFLLCWLPVLEGQIFMAPPPVAVTRRPPTGAMILPVFTIDLVAISRKSLVRLNGILLSSYDRRIRPVIDQTKAIQVDTKFVPLSITEFDTAGQQFSLVFYMQVTWKDQALRWNKYRFGGTTFIKLPVTDVWIPKLKIKEEYRGRNYVGDSSTDNAKIYWNGDVYWVPEGIYSVVCAVNIQFYPYDEQTCTLTYFVANENNLTVSLDHTGNVSLAEFVENPAWKLLQLTHQRSRSGAPTL